MTTVSVKKFRIEKVTKNNNHYVLHIKTLDLQIHVQDLRIYNLQPFTIKMNAQMEICNDMDNVKVSIDNLCKRIIQYTV